MPTTLSPIKSKLSPSDIVLLFEPSSPIVIDECCKLAFVIPAEPDKLELVRPVIVLLSATIVLRASVSIEVSVI